VNEDFQRHLGHGIVDSTNVVEREFASEDRLLVAFSETGTNIADGAIIHLRGGVQWKWRRQLGIKGYESRILGDEGIGVDGRELSHQCLGFRKLVVTKEGVEGDIDTYAKEVGIVHEPGDITDAVSCCRTSAKARSTNINGVSSVANGFETTFEVAGRSKEFYRTGHRCRLVDRGDVVWSLLIDVVV
jgi:hypothetical protein